MRFKWFDNLFAVPEAAKDRPGQLSLRISSYGIGFCPGCKRLRSVT